MAENVITELWQKDSDGNVTGGELGAKAENITFADGRKLPEVVGNSPTTEQIRDMINTAIEQWDTGMLFRDKISEIEIPVELQTGTLYTFISSEGDVFISSNQANIGIWKLNRDTAIMEKIHSTSYNWQYWLEDSQGNVFVGSNLKANGLLEYDSINNNFIVKQSVYAGNPFGNDFTMGFDSGIPGSVFMKNQKDKYIDVLGTYTSNSSAGSYGFAVSTDKKLLLYTK